MKRREVCRDPIASFPLPINAPKSIASVRGRYESVATEWARTKGAIEDAEQEVIEATAEDIKRAAAAFGSGKEPDVSKNREPAARAKLQALQGRKEALSVAVDEAGDELATAIGAAKAEWIESFATGIEDAAERYRAGIAAALEAHGELGRAIAGRVWLEEFDAGLAHVGRVRQFHGGSPPLRVKRPLGFSANDELRADELLQIAASAVDPPPGPSPLLSEALDRQPRREVVGHA